ncbi:tetratricopeptide repeat protein [bacterium]|nr:tetratricopeptide repeat protein [bacterium]
MVIKKLPAFLLLFAFAAGACVLAEEKKSIPPQTESTLPKPVESPKEPATTRKEFKRKSYAELYRESYNPKNYSKRYEEDYAENPIRTGSYDSRTRRLRRYYLDNHPQGRDIDDSPQPLNEPLNEAPAQPRQPAPPEPAVVVDPSYSPFQPDLIYMRPVLRLPAPYVYRALQKRAEERAAGISADATGESASALTRTFEPTQPQEPAELQSPSDLLLKRAQEPFASRNYYEAARRYERLLEERPDDPQVRYAYGVALFASGKYSQAAGFIQPAINAAKRQGVKLPKMSSYYSNEADFEHHQKLLNRYLKRRPDDVTAAALADMFAVK